MSSTMNNSCHTRPAQTQAKNAAATKPNTVATIAFPTLPPFTAAFDSVAAAAFCAVPDALCAPELVADLDVVVALAAFVDADEPAVCEAIGAVDCPSICFCTASEKEPDMPDIVNLEEKASAGYCGDVASLRPRDSKRMKLGGWIVRVGL